MNTLTKGLCVVLGGGTGAYLRYAAQNWAMGRWGITFPYGTLFVNLSGAFGIGLIMTLLLKHLHVPVAWRLFMVTGVLGGYTTFSALAWETYSLFASGQTVQGSIYLCGSILGGGLAVVAGVLLAHCF